GEAFVPPGWSKYTYACLCNQPGPLSYPRAVSLDGGGVCLCALPAGGCDRCPGWPGGRLRPGSAPDPGAGIWAQQASLRAVSRLVEPRAAWQLWYLECHPSACRARVF